MDITMDQPASPDSFFSFIDLISFDDDGNSMTPKASLSSMETAPQCDHLAAASQSLPQSDSTPANQAVTNDAAAHWTAASIISTKPFSRAASNTAINSSMTITGITARDPGAVGGSADLEFSAQNMYGGILGSMGPVSPPFNPIQSSMTHMTARINPAGVSSLSNTDSSSNWQQQQQYSSAASESAPRGYHMYAAQSAVGTGFTPILTSSNGSSSRQHSMQQQPLSCMMPPWHEQQQAIHQTGLAAAVNPQAPGYSSSSSSSSSQGYAMLPMLPVGGSTQPGQQQLQHLPPPPAAAAPATAAHPALQHGSNICAGMSLLGGPKDIRTPIQLSGFNHSMPATQGMPTASAGGVLHPHSQAHGLASQQAGYQIHNHSTALPAAYQQSGQHGAYVMATYNAANAVTTEAVPLIDLVQLPLLPQQQQRQCIPLSGCSSYGSAAPATAAAPSTAFASPGTGRHQQQQVSYLEQLRQQHHHQQQQRQQLLLQLQHDSRQTQQQHLNSGQLQWQQQQQQQEYFHPQQEQLSLQQQYEASNHLGHSHKVSAPALGLTADAASAAPVAVMQTAADNDTPTLLPAAAAAQAATDSVKWTFEHYKRLLEQDTTGRPCPDRLNNRGNNSRGSRQDGNSSSSGKGAGGSSSKNSKSGGVQKPGNKKKKNMSKAAQKLLAGAAAADAAAHCAAVAGGGGDGSEEAEMQQAPNVEPKYKSPQNFRLTLAKAMKGMLGLRCQVLYNTLCLLYGDTSRGLREIGTDIVLGQILGPESIDGKPNWRWPVDEEYHQYQRGEVKFVGRWLSMLTNSFIHPFEANLCFMSGGGNGYKTDDARLKTHGLCPWLWTLPLPAGPIRDAADSSARAKKIALEEVLRIEDAAAAAVELVDAAGAQRLRAALAAHRATNHAAGALREAGLKARRRVLEAIVLNLA